MLLARHLPLLLLLPLLLTSTLLPPLPLCVAICIAVITWFSIVSAALETHRNMRRLADIAHFECEAQVRGRLIRFDAAVAAAANSAVVVAAVADALNRMRCLAAGKTCRTCSLQLPL